MNNFRQFNIKPETSAFIGDKISVLHILNTPIKVLEYKIQPSIKKEGTEYLALQIEKSGQKRVVFTGSSILINMIKQVPETAFPFITTIVMDKGYYEFT